MNIGGVFAINGKIETEVLSVVVAQIPIIDAKDKDDINKNIDNLLYYMDKASAGFPGYDLFVATEGCIMGCRSESWMDLPVDLEGPEMGKLKEKCRDLKVWGIFNPWVKDRADEFNSNMAIMIHDQGEIVHKYTKMNPYIPGEAN